MKTLRGSATVVLWTSVAALSTIAAMTLGVRAGRAPQLIVDVKSRLDAQVAGAGSQRFAPLSPKLLAELFGSDSVVRLLGTFAGDELPRSGPKPAPSPDPTEEPPPEEGGVIGRLAASPDIRISMQADKSVARPGDTIRYVITVKNVGRGTAKSLDVLSHVPEHTTLVADDGCRENVALEPNPGSPAGYTLNVCVAGPPAPGEHGFHATFNTLRPGRAEQFVFKVLIDAQAPESTVISNHAHARGDFAPRTSNTVETRVS